MAASAFYVCELHVNYDVIVYDLRDLEIPSYNILFLLYNTVAH